MKQPSHMRPNARPEEAGFALVVALLALVGLTALATAGFVTSTSDYRVTQNHRASVQAFYAAEAGLSEYLGHGRPYASRSLEVSGGTAAIQAERLLELEDGNFVYQVASVGRFEPPEGGAGVRTVSAVAIFNASPFQAKAAITAAGGLEKQGVAGTVSGYDAASAGECDLAGSVDLPGLAVPPDGFSQSGGGPPGQGGGGPPGQGGGETGQGCPDAPPGVHGEPPVECAQEGPDLLEETGIDWEAVLDGAAFPFDYVYSVDGFPSFQLLPEGDWPVIRIDQASFAMNPPRSGRGTLVVDGDLVLDGSVTWEGIILVGGSITSDGNQIIRGTMVTGLNLLLGQAPQPTSLGNGTWDYRYHSCAVVNAMRGFGTLSTQPGTWAETL